MTRKPIISKLGHVILGYFAFALTCAIFSYLFLTNTASSFCDNLLSNSTFYEKTLESINVDLQNFINQENLISTDYTPLYEWSEKYPYATIKIYRLDKLLFDSDYTQVDLKNFSPYLTQTQDPSFKNYSLIFKDGEAFSSIFLFLGKQFFNTINFVSFVAVVIIFFFIFIFLLQHKLYYILEIDKVVQGYEGGALSTRIMIEGNDELSNLAQNINTMAATLEAEIANEITLREHNAQLVASLSHDIRTPLTAIISYLEIMRNRDKDPEKTDKYLEIISNKADQLKQLTDNLFDSFTTPSVERLADLKLIDAFAFIHELTQETVSLLSQEGFKVITSNTLPETIKFKLDYSLFQRIWDNIYSNIQKYADKTMPVSFSFENINNKLIITLTNTKLKGPLTVESNGIGLTNCKHLAEQLGGEFFTAHLEDTFEVKLVFPSFTTAL